MVTPEGYCNIFYKVLIQNSTNKIHALKIHPSFSSEQTSQLTTLLADEFVKVGMIKMNRYIAFAWQLVINSQRFDADEVFLLRFLFASLVLQRGRKMHFCSSDFCLLPAFFSPQTDEYE